MHDFSRFIRDIPDFPKPGISFKDITPLLANPEAFQQEMDAFAERYQFEAIDTVVGIEERGFIFASVLADRLGVGFLPIRKSGKFPFDRDEVTYALEYGRESDLCPACSGIYRKPSLKNSISAGPVCEPHFLEVCSE